MRKHRETNENSHISHVLTRMDWLILVGATLMFAGLCIWLFFGKIQSTIELVGYTNTGLSYDYIHQPESGYITSIEVEKKNFFKAGDILAYVYPCEKGESLPSMEEMKNKSVPVVATEAGYLMTLSVGKWDYVDISTPLFTYCPIGEHGVTYLLTTLDSSQMQLVDIGKTKATVVFSDMTNGVYYGTLVAIDDYPLFSDELGYFFADYDLETMSKDQRLMSYIAAIELNRDPKTDYPVSSTGYVNSKIIPEIYGTIFLDLGTKRPIDMIFNLGEGR